MNESRQQQVMFSVYVIWNSSVKLQASFFLQTLPSCWLVSSTFLFIINCFELLSEFFIKHFSRRLYSMLSHYIMTLSNDTLATVFCLFIRTNNKNVDTCDISFLCSAWSQTSLLRAAWCVIFRGWGLSTLNSGRWYRSMRIHCSLIIIEWIDQSSA